MSEVSAAAFTVPKDDGVLQSCVLPACLSHCLCFCLCSMFLLCGCVARVFSLAACGRSSEQHMRSRTIFDGFSHVFCLLQRFFQFFLGFCYLAFFIVLYTFFRSFQSKCQPTFFLVFRATRNDENNLKKLSQRFLLSYISSYIIVDCLI